jgi:hypothetical protein
VGVWVAGGRHTGSAQPPARPRMHTCAAQPAAHPCMADRRRPCARTRPCPHLSRRLPHHIGQCAGAQGAGRAVSGLAGQGRVQGPPHRGGSPALLGATLHRPCAPGTLAAPTLRPWYPRCTDPAPLVPSLPRPCTPGSLARMKGAAARSRGSCDGTQAHVSKHWTALPPPPPGGSCRARPPCFGRLPRRSPPPRTTSTG